MARPQTVSAFTHVDRRRTSGIAVLLGFVFGMTLLNSTVSADDRLDAILQTWVDVAADVEPPSLATARARFGRELSAHQLETAISLWVPDSVDSLRAQFDWSMESTRDDGTVLTGIPRDEVDRAFIGTVTVHWNGDLQRPSAIEFEGANQPIQFATIRRPQAAAVRHVAFYQEAAESSAAAIADHPSEIRTASAVIGENVTSIELPVSSDDVDVILNRWAEASSTFGPWEIAGERYCYDATFGIEKRSYFMMRGDGSGTVEFRNDPMEVVPGAVNEQKLSDNGTPYEVRAGETDALVFTPEEAIVADVVAQMLRRIPNSSLNEYAWFKHPLRTPSCMSLSLPVDADVLREQFRWEITSNRTDEVKLRGTPRTGDVARCVTAVEVILDATHFVPTAVRCLHGNWEDVQVIRERSVPTGLTAEIILAGYASYSEAEIPQKRVPGAVPVVEGPTENPPR